MAYELSNEEKITVVNQHLRTLAFSRYNYEVSVMEEQASPEPVQETLDALNKEIQLLDSKITALNDEIASLS